MIDMLYLTSPVSQLPTVNKSVARKLKTLGLLTIQDLLFYFPFRYDDFRQIVPIAKLEINTRVTVRGRLELIANKRSFFHHRFITEAVVADSTGQLKIVWFNQPYLTKILKVGDKLSLAGKVEFDRFGLQMTSPVFEKEKEGEIGVHTGRLVPIYPTTNGLTQKQIRFLIKKVLPAASSLKEWLPVEILKQNQFPSINSALTEIHFPSTSEKFKKAEARWQFEELFLIQLKNELSRRELHHLKAPQIFFKQDKIKRFVDSLPYQLTNDQRKAAWEILQNLEKKQPMNRLLDGDVGSGKTVVAAIAIYNTILNGFQVILMAPTEILASQHFETMLKLFKNKNLNICLLTSNILKISNIPACRQAGQYSILDIKKIKSERKNILNLIRDGRIDLLIGTHALIEKSVKFKKLGLAIVDEQHRFGVGQRHTLIKKESKKGKSPHFLSMTATPIPRSYSLALYGDLDLSLIKEMPKGRQKIITKLVSETNRSKAYQFIREQIKKGRQAFVICPLIEQGTSELGIEKKSVMTEYKKLSEQFFSDLRITYLHGKMKSKEKEQVIKNFLEKKFDIIVSTSVVEVGVDFPNATIMMIEGAERFGLAQLHQFRGRVGRGEHQSYCLLFTSSVSELTCQRLNYFVETNDGFTLAEKDLEMRGPGEVFGTTQHGFPELKMANLQNIEMIKKSRLAAISIIDADPELENHSLLKEKLDWWEKTVHME